MTPAASPAGSRASPTGTARRRTTVQEYGLLLTAPDDATAELHTPPGASASADVPGFVASCPPAARRIGLLLARKGASSRSVSPTAPDLVVSRLDTRYVQGRTAAGGWSQQRFARRRDNQAKAALGDAAELAVRLLLPEAGTLTDAGVRRRPARGGQRCWPTGGWPRWRRCARRACSTCRSPGTPSWWPPLAAARAVHILIRDPEPVDG